MIRILLLLKIYLQPPDFHLLKLSAGLSGMDCCKEKKRDTWYSSNALKIHFFPSFNKMGPYFLVCDRVRTRCAGGLRWARGGPGCRQGGGRGAHGREDGGAKVGRDRSRLETNAAGAYGKELEEKKPDDCTHRFFFLSALPTYLPPTLMISAGRKWFAHTAAVLGSGSSPFFSSSRWQKASHRRHSSASDRGKGKRA